MLRLTLHCVSTRDAGVTFPPTRQKQNMPVSGKKLMTWHFSICVLIKAALRVQLYWSESESEIAWNGYLDFSFVCLHRSDLSAKATSLQNGLQPNFQAKSLFTFRSYINAALQWCIHTGRKRDWDRDREIMGCMNLFGNVHSTAEPARG